MSERCPWCGAGVKKSNHTFLCGSMNEQPHDQRCDQSRRCLRRQSLQRGSDRRHAKAERLRRLREDLDKSQRTTDRLWSDKCRLEAALGDAKTQIAMLEIVVKHYATPCTVATGPSCVLGESEVQWTDPEGKIVKRKATP